MFNLTSTPHSTLQLIVRNRAQTVFNGPVKAVTSMNATGRFDILAEHANFISIINDFIIIHKPDGSKQEMKITRGVLKVDGSMISIYLGIAPEVKSKLPQS